MQYQSFIEQILREATKIAVAHFGKVTSTVKAGDNNQVLTETDLAVGKMLVSAVQQQFPDHNIIDEEAGVIDKKSRFTWVIDPIDGTSNFAAGLPHFGIMVGLLDEATPIAGGIALPAFGEVYLAEKGKGTTCNGARVHVTSELMLSNALVAYGIDGHGDDPQRTVDECALLARITLGIRNLRDTNSAFDHCVTAAGKYGATLNQTAKIWDSVAPQIILEEAGGIWTDFYGKPIDYSDPLTKVDLNFTWCGGSPELHKQLQQIIHA